MAGSVFRNCNGVVVEFPYSFKIRIYDNSLNYTTHTVRSYTTDFVNVFVYKIAKRSGKVTVWTDRDIIMARREHNGSQRIVRYSPDTSIPNIVCAMLTELHCWAVLDDSPNSIEMTLF